MSFHSLYIFLLICFSLFFCCKSQEIACCEALQKSARKPCSSNLWAVTVIQFAAWSEHCQDGCTSCASQGVLACLIFFPEWVRTAMGFAVSHPFEFPVLLSIASRGEALPQRHSYSFYGLSGLWGICKVFSKEVGELLMLYELNSSSSSSLATAFFILFEDNR